MRHLARLAMLALGTLLAATAMAAPTDGPSIWIPEVITNSGRQIDTLYMFIMWVVIIIFVITEGLLLYSVIAFRARPGHKAQFFHGSTGVEVALTIVPTLILLVITVYSGFLWRDLKLATPNDKGTIHIQVFAEQFAWNFRYTGPDGAFGTADDIMTFNEVALPANRNVVFDFSAKDVIHSFFIPEARLKQDCVPGLHTRAWLNVDALPVWDLNTQKRVLLDEKAYLATDVAVSGYKFESKPATQKAGWYQASPADKIGYLQYSYAREADAPLVVVKDGKEAKTASASHVRHYYEIGCAQLCGTSHFAMRGTVLVLPTSEFQRWLGAQTPDAYLAEKWHKFWDKFHPEFNRI